MPPTRDLVPNPGMCPDWESNQQCFGSQASAQSTEPHQPGPYVNSRNKIGVVLYVLPCARFCIVFIYQVATLSSTLLNKHVRVVWCLHICVCAHRCETRYTCLATCLEWNDVSFHPSLFLCIRHLGVGGKSVSSLFCGSTPCLLGKVKTRYMWGGGEIRLRDVWRLVSTRAPPGLV